MFTCGRYVTGCSADPEILTITFVIVDAYLQRAHLHTSSSSGTLKSLCYYVAMTNAAAHQLFMFEVTSRHRSCPGLLERYMYF